MYTVDMERECGCFKRSDFSAHKDFETQKDAYNYANIASEIMNEDFCGKHHFFSQKISENEFVIRVVENPNGSGGSCGTSSSSGSCGTSCGCD
jgi:hypothetical protein